MDTLKLLHFAALCAWAGVVLAETVIEAAGSDDASHDWVARVHYWIDLLVELPLLAAVLVTGALLSQRVYSFSYLHWIKMGAALVAVGLNLACAVLVVARFQRRGDPEAVRRLHAWVRASTLGVPFGAVAAYIGLAHFL